MTAGRALRALHRTLGLALWPFFFTWFASGIVMTFAGFPSIDESLRLERAPAIQPGSVNVLPPSTARSGDADSIDAISIGNRTLFRSRDGAQVKTTYADDGQPLGELSQPDAVALASSWMRRPMRPIERLTESDQWTPQSDVHGELPLLRLRADDEDGTEVYVSLSLGEVVQKTTRRSRFLAWVGAIPHWIYPITLRRHEGVWRGVVLVLSALGALTSGTGLVHGFRAARFGRRRFGAPLTTSPFRDPWLRWHHIAGLLFGLFAFTWVFSGMLSLYPLASFARTEPRRDEVRALRGGPLVPATFRRDISEAFSCCATEDGQPVKRLELGMVAGVPLYVCHHADGRAVVVRAASEGPPTQGLDRGFLVASTRAIGLGSEVESEEWIAAPDADYHPTHFEPNIDLPVLRTRFTSGVTVYVSAATGGLVRRVSQGARAYRLAYHGLHSFDIRVLYRHSALWHFTIVTFASGGSLFAATGAIVAFRRLRRTCRIQRSKAGGAATG